MGWGYQGIRQVSSQFWWWTSILLYMPEVQWQGIFIFGINIRYLFPPKVIFYEDRHYVIISDITSFLIKRWYCPDCLKPYFNRIDYRFVWSSCEMCIKCHIIMMMMMKSILLNVTNVWENSLLFLAIALIVKRMVWNLCYYTKFCPVLS